MDWPIATVILGILGTITAAILKLVPQRTIVENGKGERCASKEDVRVVVQSVQDLRTYTQQRSHDIINTLTPIAHDLVILVERTRFNRGSHDEIG